VPQFQLIGRNDPRIQKLDAFTIAYIEAIFFTACEENVGHPDTVAVQQLADSTLARIVFDCAQFQRRAKTGGYMGGPLILDDLRVAPSPDCSAETHAGHDFWFTRNGHGTGFWDGDWEELAGEELTKIAKQFSNLDLYRGDNGSLYFQ
jgi:hypothetical protein